MLKQIIAFLFLSLTIVSCNKDQPINGYIINGTIDESLDNRNVKLMKFDDNKDNIIDSTSIQKGEITLKGTVDKPDIYYITIDGVAGNMPIIIENEKMTITFYKDSLLKSVVKGSKENDLLKIYYDDSEVLRMKNAQLGQQYRVAKESNDSLKMTEIRSAFDNMLEASNKKFIELIKSNTNLITSAAILENMLRSKQITAKNTEEIFNTFSEKVLSSRFGESIKELLAVSSTEVGNLAPNFTAPNPKGEPVSLYDIKGKVTIIDFWAAWCGPCRRENPNVVKVFEKYHDKGLEIIGVSLDGSPKQEDAKAAWIEAIEKDNLTWHQVSNLSFFNDPIAKQYNIQAIPATFILDSEGNIIAKNLRGEALDAKIAELLN
ncbi:TlpA disulfide reductase family protein [Xanthomarina spongicola]|uniref:Peroxiredoxin n=1 Tax=Xanthomarina spongicola TaxID=570520 RepID=A0A316E9N5_9FLAO|nr:TlpA disulfide reductase family protein [Xanthomarina spongicola]PWK19590.1 peroxiredoxin [Xanthomarina spongicola]